MVGGLQVAYCSLDCVAPVPGIKMNPREMMLELACVFNGGRLVLAEEMNAT